MKKLIILLFIFSTSVFANIYLEAFDYARSREGLSLDKHQSERFVLKVKEHNYPELFLKAHKSLFQFAKQSMNLFRSDSKVLADELFQFQLPLQYAQAYIEIYKFSRSTLSYFSSDANRFSRTFWNHRKPKQSVESFKQAFIFFESIDFFKRDAITHALTICSKPNPLVEYSHFQELYEFAHSNQGLGLSAKRSAEYALRNL